jgi:hypothetical protein|tara:strand:- start:214 stop:381 length:168 start_codon:yes stop_codon:yes gene_type:complete
VQSNTEKFAKLLANDPETVQAIQLKKHLPTPCTMKTSKKLVRLRQKPGEDIFSIQ